MRRPTIIQVLHCSHCQGTDIVRHGKSSEGKQRYRCRECREGKGRTFLLDYSYAGQSPEIRQQIIDMAMNASGILDTTRVLKISPITVINELKKKNLTFLSEYKRDKLSVASEYLNQWLNKLKPSEFCHIEARERLLSFEVDSERKDHVSILDGCYVIKTELDKESISAETIHQRYKGLALVEHEFRTMKTEFLETRPVFVRKAKRGNFSYLVMEDPPNIRFET